MEILGLLAFSVAQVGVNSSVKQFHVIIIWFFFLLEECRGLLFVDLHCEPVSTAQL